MPEKPVDEYTAKECEGTKSVAELDMSKLTCISNSLNLPTRRFDIEKISNKF